MSTDPDPTKDYILEYYKTRAQEELNDINNHTKAITAYGIMLTRTSTILNGGALAILPTLYIRSDLTSSVTQDVVSYSGFFFLCGLVFSALSGLVVLRNWSELLHNSYNSINITKTNISNLFGDEDYRKKSQEYFTSANETAKSINHKIQKTYQYGYIYGFSSYALFFIGCFVAAWQLS